MDTWPRSGRIVFSISLVIAVVGTFSGMILTIGFQSPIGGSILAGSLLCAAVVALLGAAFRVRVWPPKSNAERMREAAEDPAARLRHRINQVNSAFAEAATLMDELRLDLEAQQATREALLAQANEQQRLLGVNQEQAEKIRQILVGETKATIRAERRQQWLFFALGAMASIPIGVAINLLVP